MTGEVAPGFNSLIPAPSVPSLISTEPVKLLCRANLVRSYDNLIRSCSSSDIV